MGSSDDDIAAAHLAQSPLSGSGKLRSYTVQYRESDLDFVQRLLAEEGIAWRIEEDESAPAGHTVVFFADSVSAGNCPEDATSQSGICGIRFHRASAIETSDANQSALSDKEAPASAMHTALKGMVDGESVDAATGDASAKNTSTAKGKLPHTSDPVVAISAKAGLAIVAGQDVAMTAGETIILGAGQDANLATGGSLRIHSGQAIGVLAGAIGAGTEASGKGITLIAGKGAIELQAQADTLQVAAKDDVSIQSKSEHIDWAAAKKIVLATKGGASITIEGGNITVQCPGTITVRASTKSFVGPEGARYALPELAHGEFCLSCFLRAAKRASALVPA